MHFKEEDTFENVLHEIVTNDVVVLLTQLINQKCDQNIGELVVKTKKCTAPWEHSRKPYVAN